MDNYMVHVETADVWRDQCRYVVLKEAEASRKANPNNHIRLLAYDNFKQSQCTNMVIFRGKTV